MVYFHQGTGCENGMNLPSWKNALGYMLRAQEMLGITTPQVNPTRMGPWPHLKKHWPHPVVRKQSGRTWLMEHFRLWGQIPLPSSIESPFPHLYIENIKLPQRGAMGECMTPPSIVSGTDQTFHNLVSLAWPGSPSELPQGWQIPDLVLLPRRSSRGL